MPYQWIYSTYHGERHKFPDHVSEMIESAYCNVKQQSFQKWQGVTGANIDLDLDFDVMNGTISGQYCGRNELNLFVRIERLSTLSQVETINKSSDLSTKWIWYWKDNGNIWKPYSNSQNPGEANNDEIEAAKLRGDNEYRFAAGRYHYILNFSKMQQQNQDEHYKTTRDVRRRPVYVGSDAVKQIKRSPRHKIPTLVESTCTGLPSNWEVMPAGKDLAQYHLSPGSRDFQRVEDLFRKTMPSSNSTIVRIERIQNMELWEHYQSMKKHMKRKQPGQEIEKQLFHGTEKSSVQKICKQNFDFRVSGKHATVYGEGAYFARDASYSDSFSRKDESGYQYMFLANVLIGRYTEGNSSYKRPPEIDSVSGTLYNSCVNNTYNPKIFIVFDLYQCYPEYLITYSKDLFRPDISTGVNVNSGFVVNNALSSSSLSQSTTGYSSSSSTTTQPGYSTTGYSSSSSTTTQPRHSTTGYSSSSSSSTTTQPRYSTTGYSSSSSTTTQSRHSTTGYTSSFPSTGQPQQSSRKYKCIVM
uniref:Poly [ADP-ribose] polymerase n=1 Tax=Saccoglossus kowalevskii TaxID=10224 RepID=A0ABM0GQU2_SACKO|nr:PREDICTED: poly [ADP-ribose] polymerase 12-like [Saccoglossus kowalevskii]